MWIHWPFFPKTWTKGHWPLDDPMSVEVTCVTLPKDHCVQVPWQYINVCGYSDQFCKISHTYTYILRTYYVHTTLYVQNEWSHSLLLNSVQARQKGESAADAILLSIMVESFCTFGCFVSEVNKDCFTVYYLPDAKSCHILIHPITGQICSILNLQRGIENGSYIESHYLVLSLMQLPPSLPSLPLLVYLHEECIFLPIANLLSCCILLLRKCICREPQMQPCF